MIQSANSKQLNRWDSSCTIFLKKQLDETHNLIIDSIIFLLGSVDFYDYQTTLIIFYNKEITDLNIFIDRMGIKDSFFINQGHLNLRDPNTGPKPI